jgi:hypothetical protein
VKETDPRNSEFLGVARKMLGENGADPLSFEATFEAAQKVFRRFYDHLRPRIGDGAFRSMLQLAHRRAMRRKPVLGRFIVQSEANPFLGEASSSVEGADEADLCEGLTHLLAESLVSLRDLGRDQDWGLVELWPGLDLLHRHGLTSRPEVSREKKPPPDDSGDSEP